MAAARFGTGTGDGRLAEVQPDSDRDGRAELVTTAPYENDSAGFAWVLDGAASGVTTNGSWSFGAAALGASQDNACFGSLLGK
ncbi:hypothetical protein QF037_009062 [Streptomyces canus]|uniref:hypothetical protein n=1 Tax=Streptomyces canus TaxID=58343 RepID=UPI0027824920|nr:hypothetical protein [Streptomyces canus]MDQ0604717.1 hypothetical protein [Streptomyces canus]